MASEERTPCPHDYLRFGSGGYYIICHCGQMWTARGKAAARDDQFDRSGNSTTPLSTQRGALVWRSEADLNNGG